MIRSVTACVLIALSSSACSYIPFLGNDFVRDSVVRIVARGAMAPAQAPGSLCRTKTATTGSSRTTMSSTLAATSQWSGPSDAGSTTYIEAYPEVRIATYDREADLAVLELRNVPDKKMPPLEFAEPRRDGKITSWGYPASNLVTDRTLGLTRKDGRTLNLVKLPVHDRTTGELVRDGAIEGLVVSTELEPGFSGGPTTDSRGRVVGINVLKDTQHHGQNGAIHVEVLRDLLAGIRTPTSPPPPKCRRSCGTSSSAT